MLSASDAARQAAALVARIAELRRRGDGVLPTTLHSAKGLEFRHVPIADGGWLSEAAPVGEPPPADIIARRHERLTPADLDMRDAGRDPPCDPIHSR